MPSYRYRVNQGYYDNSSDRERKLESQVESLQAELKDARTHGPDEVLGVERGDDQFASKVRARLARRQFEDFKERFAPIQRDLAEFATGDAGREEALDDASASVMTASETQQGAAERRLARFGVARSDAQRRSDTRERVIERTATEVGARNRARQDVEQRKTRLMTGGFGVKPTGGA